MSESKLDTKSKKLKGAFYADAFLKTYTLDEFSEDFFSVDDVIVTGGDQVAMEVAQAARKLMAKSVTILAPMGFDHPPSKDNQISIKEGWNLIEIKGDPDHATQVIISKTTVPGDPTDIKALPATAIIIANEAEKTDASSCAVPSKNIKKDQEIRLAKDGFEKRGFFDEPKLSDVVEMYEESGFEVRLEPFAIDEEDGCVSCMRLDHDRYKTIYTKKKP